MKKPKKFECQICNKMFSHGQIEQNKFYCDLHYIITFCWEQLGYDEQKMHQKERNKYSKQIEEQ